MPSPFPGMDPYLEHPAVFPDLHDSLIAFLRESLNAVLPEPYYAGIAARVWIETSDRHIEPDVEVVRASARTTAGNGGVAVAENPTAPVVVHVPLEEFRETFLEIYARPGGERLVTTIEILSLTNKTPGKRGRELYVKKQAELLESQVHLVEIDLLRSGSHTTAVPLDFAHRQAGEFDYHACIRRFDLPEDYLVYPIRLEDRLPTIQIPLLPDDTAVTVDLQAAIDRCYDSGRYERRVRYDQPPVPPLTEARSEWAHAILREKVNP